MNSNFCGTKGQFKKSLTLNTIQIMFQSILLKPHIKVVFSTDKEREREGDKNPLLQK